MKMRTGLTVFGAPLMSAAFACSTPSTVNTGTSGQTEQATTAADVDDDTDADDVGGRLMIVGGNMRDDSVIVDRLIADAGGKRKIRALVIPGANFSPVQSFTYFQGLLTSRGVKASRVDIAKIAVKDDDSTPDVDERMWKNGASDPVEVKKLKKANVVWFSGGDQNRLITELLDSSGHDTPFQAALRAKLAAGKVIVAGSSAGAAIMSDPMIGGGTSFASLAQAPTAECDGDTLCTNRGLGYIPAEYNAISDQHFTQRGRFARLVRTLALTNRKNGWGVSENTGFYIDLISKKAEVVGVPGEGFVTLIGRSGAAQNHESVGPPFLGDGYLVSVLSVRDTYTLPTAAKPNGVATHPAASDIYAPFSAYYDNMPIFNDGFGKDVLVDDIATYFADGTAQATGAPRVDALAFNANPDGSATGFRLRFTADAQSSVAYSSDSLYSIYNARLQITTLSATFVGIGP